MERMEDCRTDAQFSSNFHDINTNAGLEKHVKTA